MTSRLCRYICDISYGAYRRLLESFILPRNRINQFITSKYLLSDRASFKGQIFLVAFEPVGMKSMVANPATYFPLQLSHIQSPGHSGSRPGLSGANKKEKGGKANENRSLSTQGIVSRFRMRSNVGIFDLSKSRPSPVPAPVPSSGRSLSFPDNTSSPCLSQGPIPVATTNSRLYCAFRL